MRLLIVEDDRKTADALTTGPANAGFSTATAQTGEEGFSLVSAGAFDLVVLDWMLPGRSGIEILKALRARGFAPCACIRTLTAATRQSPGKTDPRHPLTPL